MSEATAPDAERSEATITAPDAVQKSEVVSVDEFRKLQASLNALAAQMRTANKTTKPDKQHEETEAVSLASLKRELEAEKQKRAETENATRRKLAASAFRDELKKQIPNDHVARDLASSFVAKYGNALAIGEDDTVHVIDVEGADPKPVAVVITEWLGTEHGKAYLPAKAGPNGDGLNSGRASHTSVASEWSRLSYDEIMRRAKTDVGAYLNYARQFPEELARKQREKK